MFFPLKIQKNFNAKFILALKYIYIFV